MRGAENLYGAEDTEVLRPGERLGFATVGSLRYKGASRQQYSAKEKVRMVIAGLRGEHSVAELCPTEEHQPEPVLSLVEGPPGGGR